MTMLLKKYLRKKLNNIKYCLGSNKYKGIFVSLVNFYVL